MPPHYRGGSFVYSGQRFQFPAIPPLTPNSGGVQKFYPNGLIIYYTYFLFQFTAKIENPIILLSKPKATKGFSRPKFINQCFYNFVHLSKIRFQTPVNGFNI